MTEHKFTDEEVIRELECEIRRAECANTDYLDCVEVKDFKLALDLINRQREEIERLKKHREEPSPTPNNTCICCGEIIPEGRQICPTCEKQLNDFKLKGKTKIFGKYVPRYEGIQLTIDDMKE